MIAQKALTNCQAMEDVPILPKRRVSYAHSVQSAHMNGMESTVHLLENELRVASIDKDHLPSASHTLVGLLLKLLGPQPECRRNCFFSFTETVADYSIIVDSHLLPELCPPGAGVQLDLSTDKWRPLLVEVGPLGCVTGISKLAASVIGPLADKNVSVFCLSTNMDDYVMVKERDLQKALACLAKSFKLTCDSCQPKDISLVKSLGRPSCSSIDSPVRKQAAPKSRPLVHPYICSCTPYSVCGVMPSALPSIASTLLHYMLYRDRSPSSEPFFSLSVIEEDISLVMDASDIQRFPVDSLYLSNVIWRVIRIGEGPLGFDECGIVAQVSAPLALAEISTYYICTFLTDHTLVPSGSAEKALELLNENTPH